MICTNRLFVYACLFLHYIDEGNVYLRNGEVSQAIDCYDKALKLGTHLLL